MAERRIVFQFGVTYETPIEKLRQIPELVRQIFAEQAQTRLDRAHFKQMGAYSLDFEVACYVLAPDYNLYMNIQQAVNLSLMECLAEAGIDFAFPTQTLFLQPASA
jgi:small-conductance mechanosensitive channel